MLKLDLSRDAGDFIAELPGKQFKQVVSAMLSLLKNPQPQDVPSTRPLTGMEGYYRVDSGEYRIVFHVAGDLLRVPLIGKRNDDAAYRHLGRKI
jgi:mRNA interferase RelE/StbE